ncbi:MAG TPA: hypothetical protein VF173_37285 [Thermoanaerobaculia bacterium]|nr:hypothetical protein [Thermoanaerobaculia bacterium]
MSCPEWSRLAARRDEEPAVWTEALEHLDGCPRCRPEALKADPLLLFRRLPVAKLAPAEERSEADSMRLAVAAMRTAGRLEESRHRFAGWRRWAAAAVLALAALGVGRDRALRPTATALVPGQVPAAFQPARAVPAAAQEPLAIEGLNRPGARVYQINGEGLSVTWIVDESLEI